MNSKRGYTPRRTDGNHAEVVGALKDIGASVLDIHALPDSLDLLVGFRGSNFILEVKDGSKPPSHRKLTDNEKKFFDTWRGYPPRIVSSPDDAIEYVISETEVDDGLPF